MKYILINENGICNVIYESSEKIVAAGIMQIDESIDPSIYLGKRYVNGKWLDSINLTYDKGIVTATITNVYGELLTEFNGDIIFNFELEEESVSAINGIASIEFTIIDSGEYIVTTVNNNMNNGVVVING